MINSTTAMGVALMLETAALSGDLMRQKQKQAKIHCIPAVEAMNFLFFPILCFLFQPYFLQTLILLHHCPFHPALPNSFQLLVKTSHGLTLSRLKPSPNSFLMLVM